MVEDFNGFFYLIIFLIVLAMNSFYGFNCLFRTEKFLAKYNISIEASFFCRFAGAIISASVLMQIYILFRGTEATWAFYGFEIDKLGLTEGSSREGYISTGLLALFWAILCFGLADKIYI